MPATFLAVNYRSGTTPQLVLYTVFGTFSQGNSFGSLDTGTSSFDLPFNRAINFNTIHHSPAEPGGIYVAANATIWKSTDNGISWTAVHTLTDISTSNSILKSGLNILYVDGAPALSIFYKGNTSTQWYGAFSYDGNTWTTQGPYALFGTGTACLSNDHIYNNILYCTYHEFSTQEPLVIGYDPGAGNMNIITLSGLSAAGSGPITMCEFNNELLVVFWSFVSGGRWRLARVVGNTAVLIDSDIIGSSSSISVGSIPTMFVDGSSLYIIIYGSTGLQCWTYTSAFAKTNITSTVLPAAMVTTTNASRVATLVDMQTLPPYPQPWILHTTSGTAGTAWNAYQWNGASTTMTLAGSGGDTAHALPMNRRAIGSYFFDGTAPTTIPGLHIEIVDRSLATTTNGVRIKFRLYGDVTGAVNVRFFYGNATAEYATTICTIESPNSGTLLGSNIITGLTVNNGGSLYEVTWRADTDGFSIGSRYRLVADAFFT